jgi:GAF domain-containing protein
MAVCLHYVNNIFHHADLRLERAIIAKRYASFACAPLISKNFRSHHHLGNFCDLFLYAVSARYFNDM